MGPDMPGKPNVMVFWVMVNGDWRRGNGTAVVDLGTELADVFEVVGVGDDVAWLGIGADLDEVGAPGDTGTAAAADAAKGTVGDVAAVVVVVEEEEEAAAGETTTWKTGKSPGRKTERIVS